MEGQQPRRLESSHELKVNSQLPRDPFGPPRYGHPQQRR